jgi:GTP-binding protein EngB required for normal cell division
MSNTVRGDSSNLDQDACRIILESIQHVCVKFNIVSLKRQTEAAQALFGENLLIDVAILGQFKAGKSSFINSLIGRPILPVGVIPVTTVITRLQYGERVRAVVTYFSGGQTVVDLAQLENFISEAKNPANEKNVEVVDIELPSLKPYTGLRLVDTPGLGSVFRYNTETSEEWLPQVGTAIVAISSDRPLSESDLNLIRELTGYTPKVVLLLTKADLLTEDQQKEVTKFFHTALKKAFGREFPIFLYSTVRETELYKRWLDRLLLDLAHHRETESLTILEYKVRSLADRCIDYLKVALNTAAKADIDRGELKKLVLDEKVKYEVIESELSLVARESKHQTRTFIAARLESVRPQYAQELAKRLKTELPSWRGNLWKLTRRYEEWLEESLTRDLAAISKKEHMHFFGTLTKAQASISRSVELFKHFLNMNIEKVLGVKLGEADWKIEVSEPSHPDVAFTKTFDFHLDLLWFVIPMFVFRKVFERHFLKGIPMVVEIHLSRLAYQWEVRVNQAIENVKGQALRYVQEELATIDALLSRTAGQTDEIHGVLKDIESGLTNLNGKEVSPDTQDARETA